MAAKGLLVMDVDSTLIEEEVIDLLGGKAVLNRSYYSHSFLFCFFQCTK